MIGTFRRRRRSVKRVKRDLQKGGKNMSSLSKFPNVLSVNFNRRVDGGSFTMQETKLMPLINWTKPPRTDTYYTYICFDIDSSMPSWIHLLVVNCTASSLNSGVSLLNWEPPAPSKGTGEHRYTFGLYSHMYPISMTPIINRGGFNVQKYIENNGLIPVAGANMKVSAPP